MHAVAALALLLCASPTDLPAIRLAAPSLALVHVEENVGSFFTEHLAQQFKLLGFEVVTAKEMQSLLGLERQKQLLGCGADTGSCMAELASALGAEGLLLGDIAKIGARYQVNLKIIAARSGKTIAVFSQSATSEEDVVDTLTTGARSMAPDVYRAFNRPVLSQGGGGVRKWSWVPLVVGVAAAAGGAISYGVSQGAYQHLRQGQPVTDGAATLTTGRTTEALGVTGFVVGGVALAGAAAMFLLGAPAPVSIALGPQGAAIVVRGEFP